MLKQIALGIVLLAGSQAGTAWADEAQNRALFDAAKSGNKVQIKALISKGVDVNAKDDDGCTPLHLAADYGRKAVAELLIMNGAYVNATCYAGVTPLHMAAGSGKKDVLGLLIAKGADVNAKTNDYLGITPLEIAVLELGSDDSNLSPAEIKEYEDVIDMLITNGAKQ